LTYFAGLLVDYFDLSIHIYLYLSFYLSIHLYIHPSIHPSNYASGLPIQELIQIIGLPEDSYILRTEILEPNAAWELLMLADTLLMPSKSEGFGLPMLEAQIMGVPVVTTRFGAMRVRELLACFFVLFSFGFVWL
jgi:glycosyltransferase involved in cell wall biosynthesis